MRAVWTWVASLTIGLPLCGQARAPAFHVSGRVVDEDHRPLAGVQVRVGSGAGGEVVGSTAADGGFRVRLPDRDDNSIFSRMGEYLDLEAEGRLTARMLVGRRSIYGFRRRNLGGQDVGTVVLPKGKPIQVRVRKERGRPLQGAVVTADSSLRGASFAFAFLGSDDVVPEYFSRVVTDEKGAAVIHGHGEEGVAVVVEAEGYYRKRIPFQGPGMPLVVVMEKGGIVSGKVIDHEGKPVRALLSMTAEVEPVSFAYTLARFAGADRIFTAEDGSFRLNLAHPHRYRIAAYPIRGVSFYLQPPKSSEVLVGPQQDVVIQLDRPRGVEGGVAVQVVDAGSGEPVAGFRAAVFWQSLQHVNAAWLEAQFESSALTAKEKGRILLPPPRAGAQHVGGVMVKAEGHATALVEDVRWDEDQPVKVCVKLRKELPVHGVVVDEKTGDPVAGALVWTVRGDKERAGGYYPGLEQHPGAVLTDDKGRFRLRGLGEGKHRVHASHPVHPDLKPRTVKLEAGEALAPLTLKMLPGLRYAGRIKGGHRPGWKLRLVARNRGGARRFLGAMPWGHDGGHTVEIGADGRFAFVGLEEGDYDAYLVVPRLAGPAMQIKLPSEVELEEDQEDAEIDISKALPGRVRGKVAVNGIPAPPGRLVLVAEDVGSAPGANVFVSLGSTSMSGPRTTIRRDGTFDLELAPEKHRLKVVDAATGVVLWQDTGQVAIESGTTSRQEITVDLVLVRVKLVPSTENGRIVAAWLRVDVDWPEPERGGLGGIVVHDVGTDLGGPGVPLSGGQRELHLYLPMRQTTLQVQSNARSLRLDEGQRQGGQPPLAEHRFTPEPGKTNRIEMKVLPPPEIEDGG